MTATATTTTTAATASASAEVPPADTAPALVESAGRTAQRNAYGHLVPLFAARAGLPDRHPHRERLREELIAGYLPVARHIAGKYSMRGGDLEDMEQVASMGLVLAVDRFDPDRDVDFLAFAVPTITGEVLRYFRDRATTIRLPRRLRQLQGQIYDAAAELAQRHGRAARPWRWASTAAAS